VSVPEDPLALDTRRRIFDHVAAHPGTHMRELQRQLAMSGGTLEYHLRVLTREGLLAERRTGRYLRYYVAAQVGRREKDVLGLLRQAVPRRICAQLLLKEDQSHGELLQHFEMAPSTLSFHLRKLVDGEVVDARREGRETRFRVRDPALVAKCLSDHRASFVDELVDRFADVWLDLGASLEKQEAPGGAERGLFPAGEPDEQEGRGGA
jgi:predicted transcriptional regulator